MNPILKQELYDQWVLLRKQTGLLLPSDKEISPDSDGAHPLILQDTFNVAALLKSHPCAPAREVAQQTHLSKERLTLAYKLIQRSPNLLTALRTSANEDYFRVVDNYFNSSQFTIVFFVGRFPPINRRDGSPGQPRLTKKIIRDIFHDLETLKAGQADIVIKISDDWGSFADIQALECIIRLARALNIRVKIQTCGTLIHTPRRRKISLTSDDIRINLNTADPGQYGNLMGPEKNGTNHGKAFSMLSNNIMKLIEERNRGNNPCRIGLNCIITEFNYRQLRPLIALGKDLGIDYVDFKADHFSAPDPVIHGYIEEEVLKAKKASMHPDYEKIYINFADTLLKGNLFWHPWSGMFDSLKQASFKIFVNSDGYCSPVDYGVSRHPAAEAKKGAEELTIGRLREGTGILDMIENAPRISPVPIREFNPFDMMLALETIREESDDAWGIPASCNPYRPSRQNELPSDIMNGYREGW